MKRSNHLAVSLCILLAIVLMSVISQAPRLGVFGTPVAHANGFIDFEDGTDGQTIQSTIPGLRFVTTNNQDWIYGDWRTAQYNGKYPAGKYTSNGNFFAWLGANQGYGVIDFTQSGATYIGFQVSTPNYVTLSGYDDSNNLITTTTLNTNNLNTGKTEELRIDAPTGKTFSYVIVSGQANYWLIDDLYTDAAGVPNTRTPVVLIPGIMGTRFNNRNGEVWPNEDTLITSVDDESLHVLELNTDGDKPAIQNNQDYTTVATGDIIRSLPRSGDVYQSLIDYFVKRRNYTTCSTYTEVCAKGTLFIFPYDWRKDINAPNGAVTQLGQLIARIQNQTGARKVNIIAHSMGGLVARSYIANQTRAANVSTLITLGTPYFGAPKAYHAVHYTTCMADKILGLKLAYGCWINRNTLKQISQNFPGVYELMPSAAYFSVYPGHVYINYDSDGRNGVDGWLSYAQIQSILSSEHNKKIPQKAQDFHNLIDGYKNGTNGVRVFAFVGDGQTNATPGYVDISLKRKWYKPWEKEITYDFHDITGDGTVPLRSANLGSGQGATDFSGNIPIFYKDLEHGDLPKDSKDPARTILPMVADILDTAGSNSVSSYLQTTRYVNNDSLALMQKTMPSSSKSPVSAGTSSAVGVRTAPELLTGRQLLLQGMAKLEVHDADGNVVRLAPNEQVEQSIPGSSITNIGNSTSIFLPEGKHYQAYVYGKANDVVDLKLRTIVAENIQQTVVYKDVRVTPHSIAQLDYDITQQPDYTLKLDNNGDGMADATVSPFAIVNSAESADITAPTSTIQVEGAKGSDGWYVGNATITITASDNTGGSGIGKIEYSQDGGITVKTYTGPFTVDTHRVHNIYVKAVDRAGNEQEPLTIARLRAYQAFAPLAMYGPRTPATIPSPTVTSTPIATRTATPTLTPTATSNPPATPTVTLSPPATPTATLSPPPTPTPTNIVTPTMVPTPAQPPAAPSNLQAIALSSSQFQLSWQDNATDESGFHVYDGGNLVATTGADTTSFRYEGLAPDSYHCLTVYAYNSSGESSFAGWACATTLADSGNLLANGSFELDDNSDGKPDAWALNSKFTRNSSVVYSGSHAGRHYATDNSSYRVWQWIPAGITAETSYSFAGYVNIPATSDSFKLQIEVSWWSDDGTTLISTVPIKAYTTSTDGTWDLAAANLVAPPGTKTATVRMVVESLNGAIYVDDFSLR